jgi:hypothetical protein
MAPVAPLREPAVSSAGHLQITEGSASVPPMSGAQFKHAAFAREDVGDARRGHPDFVLRDYALARGLDFRPTGAPPNFETVVPEWAEYVFNSMSGILPGGAVGVLEHELMEVEVSTGKAGPRMGGTLFDEVYVKKDPFFFQPSYWKRPKQAPFAGNAIWIPTTRLMARVPEAALVPRTMAVRSDRLTATGRYDLDRHGLRGFALQYGDEPEDEALLDRLFAGPAGRFLAAARSAYVDLDLDGGIVAVRCNGFLREPTVLDEIALQFSGVVAGVREACAPYLQPRPFEEPLPEPPWVDREHPPSGELDLRSSPWWEAWRQTSTQLGMTLEDPKAYHRAYPSNPVPSVAVAVMRDTAPDGRTYRLAFHRARGPHDVRAAAVFGADAGGSGSTTQPKLIPESGMWLQGDGTVVACWDQAPGPMGVVGADLLERVRATAARTGLA